MTAVYNWRDLIEVHPAADMFPMMSDAELDDLAEDIKAHGLHEQLILWKTGNKPVTLIDGRNRVAALARLLTEEQLRFYLDPSEWMNARCGWPGFAGGIPLLYGPGTKGRGRPQALVASLNLHRRHLTTEQRKDLAAKLLAADPSKSNRAIADQAKLSHVTVGAIRDDLEARGQIDHVERTDSKGRKVGEKPTRAAAIPEPALAPLLSNEDVLSVADPATGWSHERDMEPKIAAVIKALNRCSLEDRAYLREHVFPRFDPPTWEPATVLPPDPSPAEPAARLAAAKATYRSLDEYTRRELLRDALFAFEKRLAAEDQSADIAAELAEIASAEAVVAEVAEPTTTAPEPEQAPVAPPQPAASWVGTAPPIPCKSSDGKCRYGKCSPGGRCLIPKLDDDPTAGLPLGVPARKAASTEPPPLAL